MATKSVEKSSKSAAKAKTDKKLLAKAKETMPARRPASAAAKPAARPSTAQKSSAAKSAPASKSAKTAAAKPTVKAPATKSAPAKAPAAKSAATKAAPPKSKTPVPPAKTPAAKSAPAKPDAKKADAKKSVAPAKPTDKKAAVKSAPAADASKMKKGAAPEVQAPKSNAAPAKPGAKPAPEKKQVDKAAAEKKGDLKTAQKGSPAPQPDTSAKKPAGKTGKSAVAAKTMTESPAMKKPLVGQKPRSDRPASMTLAASLTFMPKANQSVNESSVKSSPASQEAKLDFKVNDHVVYPAHGVGRIVGIERQVIAGIVNELFLIDFEQEKMKLRVPTAKAKAVGMRALSEPTLVKKALETLKGRARIKRTMWSRRAQEYEAKINSGDIISVAEVVRDLFRASDQPEQSYSERQLFEAALDRLAREVAAVHKTDLSGALAELEGALQQKKAA